MTVSKIGLVAYADDPTAVIRKVYPEFDDLEISTDTCHYQDAKTGNMIRCPCGDLVWRAHLHPGRQPVLTVVLSDSPEAQAQMTGTA